MARRGQRGVAPDSLHDGLRALRAPQLCLVAGAGEGVIHRIGAISYQEDYQEDSTGLSTQVTVVFAGLLHPSDRDRSTQVTVENSIHIKRQGLSPEGVLRLPLRRRELAYDRFGFSRPGRSVTGGRL